MHDMHILNATTERDGIVTGGSMTAFAAATRTGELLYLSGQIAPEPDRGPASTVVSQTEAAYRQVEQLLASHNLTLQDVRYVTGYLNNPADFDEYHATWRKVFPVDPPARTTVAAAILADNALIELSVIAALTTHPGD
ncbi:RidA family protein [Rhodococcus sp. NPDC056960]|uniref:RidA family protein n=1 Tax=Rhodococcus sp. NPDC056960 TaxID=3345982 RepID=UPI00363C224A